MAIAFNDNIRSETNKPLDFKFGPFISVAQANSIIPIEQRYIGLVVGIIEGDRIVKYQYFSPLSDTDIEKVITLSQDEYDKLNSLPNNFTGEHSQLSLNDGTNPHGTTSSDVGLGSFAGLTPATLPVSNAASTAISDKVGGSGDFTQISYWSSVAKTQTGNPNFTWNPSNSELRMVGGNSSVFKLRGDTVGSAIYISDVNADTTTLALGNSGAITEEGNSNMLWSKTALEFYVNFNKQWEITTDGVLQADGSKTIQTLSGDLVLQGNGGTVRIPTVPNDVGDFITRSETGIIQRLTPTQTMNHLGAVTLSTFQTITGHKVFAAAETEFLGRSIWSIGVSGSANQRMIAVVDEVNFARLHWQGVDDVGGVSNYRSAWYDGDSYINITAVNNTVDVDGNIEADAFIKEGGTSSQFLKADGSVDSNSYQVAGSYVTLNTFQTVTGHKVFGAAETGFLGRSIWSIGVSGSADQRMIAVEDEVNFARLHWQGTDDTNAISNYRSAWYDGTAYINLTANSGAIEIEGNVEAEAFVKTGGTASQFLKADGSVEEPADILKSITGYNPAVAQRLEHDASGVIQWVDIV